MEKLNKFILITVFFITATLSQELKSLLTEVIKNQPQQNQDISVAHEAKCSFSIRMKLTELEPSMTPSQRQQFNSLNDRPEVHTYIDSPKGYFRIHFDSTGINKPQFDVNEFALYCDEVYDKEIDDFGFQKPPVDNNEGGDNKYDIYILNIGFYGETVFPAVGSPAYGIPSFIKIDNDFIGYGFHTHGIDAAKVTIAHEFNHAIQIGYVWQASDLFFYEMTSVAMEELVYDDVNDYYSYLPDLFNDPELSITSTNGERHYAFGIFNMFLVEKLGVDILPEIWEGMRTNKALGSLNTVLSNKGYSFGEMFDEFSDWLYFTGSRAVEGKYFEEASNYPEVTPTNKFVINTDTYSKEMIYNTKPVSNNFVCYVDSSNSEVNTVMVRITNSDYSTAIVEGNSFPVEFNFNKGIEAGDKIAENYFGLLKHTDVNFISNQYYMNGKYASEYNNGSNKNNNLVYPQPYKPQSNSRINFTVDKNTETSATLIIFSLTMEKLYSAEKEILQMGNFNIVRWDGITDSGNKLSSGVYFYVIDVDGNTSKGKFAVINE